VLVETRLTTHPDRSRQVERQIGAACPRGLCADERIQSLPVCRFSVAVEKECGMVWRREISYVHFLEIRRKLMYPMSLEELVGGISNTESVLLEPDL
jgi:hypothetical protein